MRDRPAPGPLSARGFPYAVCPADAENAADIPAVLVLLAIPVTLILASLVAAGPGLDRCRVRPALVLRSE